jgi:hypothetical protein
LLSLYAMNVALMAVVFMGVTRTFTATWLGNTACWEVTFTWILTNKELELLPLIVMEDCA